MKDIVKTFEKNDVRIIMINNEPYFRVGDVGKVLDLSNVYRNLKQFDKGCHSVTTLTNGGEQEVIYISEPNLYRLIFQSRKEEARRFQDWIFEEVLPSIRKTGKYSIPDNLKQVSKTNRKLLTEAWSDGGIEKKHHFIQLTLQEYRALGIDKKKKDMTKEEILTLSAFESMEALKLFHDPKGDYYECKESLFETAKSLPIKKVKEIK